MSLAALTQLVQRGQDRDRHQYDKKYVVFYYEFRSTSERKLRRHCLEKAFAN